MPKYNPTFRLWIFNQTENDPFTIPGNVIADSIGYGVLGNDLDNTINGSAGHDTIDGGLGADQMAGGKGNDVYVVDDENDVIIENANEGSDLVRSYLTSFDLRNFANVESLMLMDNAVTGIGNSLNNHILGNNLANVIDGNEGNDRLFGGGGNDILSGGADNDSLDGGLGQDTMAGGVGNDDYLIDDAADVIVELAGEGIDTVNSFISHTLGENFEHLALKDHVWSWIDKNINGTGNELANRITGNSGKNMLKGLDGDDTIDGGLGNDFLAGGDGKDMFVFSTALGNNNVDTISDFDQGQDKIWLDGDIFKKVDCGCSPKPMDLKEKFFAFGEAQDENDHIILDQYGRLFYDADGSGTACEAQLFARVEAGRVLSASDFAVV